MSESVNRNLRYKENSETMMVNRNLFIFYIPENNEIYRKLLNATEDTLQKPDGTLLVTAYIVL